MDRKRKNNDNYNDNKRRQIDWTTMISGSSIRNYMLDDPLLDWLKYYSIDSINSKPKQISYGNVTKSHNNNNNINTFTGFIMEQGIEFEKYVYDYLKQNFNTTQVSFSNDSQNINKFHETLDLMKQGVHIIYQGVLHDYNLNLYGCPDLLIRTDKFNEIFKTDVNFLNIRSCKLNKEYKYHYVIVDIKHSTLQFNCNRDYIKNINSIAAYKGQILIYNKILNNLFGINCRYGFILCKKTIYTKNRVTHINDNFMENIGIIDYNGCDKFYINKVNEAINWIRRMRTLGHTWKLLPTPSVKELYPNMKNTKDDHYRKLKIDLSEHIHEITNIWWCSYNKREYAHSKNILKWSHPNFNSKLLGLKESNVSRTIDNILNINRQNNIKIRCDDLIKTNNWRSAGNTLEIYIDFETLNGNIGQFEDSNYNDIIFMVCLGWEYNNEFRYKSFVLENNTNECEFNMIQEMWDFIDEKMIELNKTEYVFIHWSNAEITFYNKFLNKHIYNNFNVFNSFDLYKLFIDNNIVVKGALNFSLKTIANAMYNNRLISTCWDSNSSCSNGLQAMYLAYKFYNNSANLNSMNEIIKYNMIDCKVMWEILSYLRNNY
jgi:hypothetical protein